MAKVDYILCHGSGNRFVMIDAVRRAAQLAGADLGALARRLCRLTGDRDGLLLFVRRDEGPAMRMFNPDGTEAEMCGNGIRCVARLAASCGLGGRFVLFSGGRPYAVTAEEPLPGGIPCFGVEIPLRRSSPDFLAGGAEAELLEGPVPALDPSLRFTYLHPGNPHLVAAVAPQALPAGEDPIDLGRLERLGRRAAELPAIFPRGVNVSLFLRLGEQHIYVATCERGAGITSSCGTAMTSCSTAACLAGLCRFGEPIRVSNRGGEVRCLCRCDDGRLVTRLSGNATFEADGSFELDPSSGAVALCGTPRPRADETAAYAAWLRSLSAQLR